VKPENIFLQHGDYDLFVKLLDFGIAKEIDAPPDRSVTGTGVGVGTPGYISPEQVVNAKRVDHRADLWSLGAVAYRCITGKLPYDCTRRGWWTGLTHPCEPPSHHAEGLSPELDAWFARALHPVADKRFPNARDMAAALAEVVGRREPPPALARHASDEGPSSSIRPGQFGLFDDVHTDEGTLIMDDGDHVRAEERRESESDGSPCQDHDKAPRAASAQEAQEHDLGEPRALSYRRR
jgi:serine/threonine protein kinase